MGGDVNEEEKQEEKKKQEPVEEKQIPSSEPKSIAEGEKDSKYLEDKDGKKRICRAVMESEAEQERLADIEDSDPRFLHTIKTLEGADPKRKFFKNTSGEYLM